MKERNRIRKGRLTSQELRFVDAWRGDKTAAARKAGFRQPKQAAANLMKKPEVYRAIQLKQTKIIAESATKLGKKLARTDITDGILSSITRLKFLSKTISRRRQLNSADVRASVKVLDALTDSCLALANLHGFLLGKNMNSMLDIAAEGARIATPRLLARFG